MTALMIALCTFGQLDPIPGGGSDSPDVRIGPSFMVSFPTMGDEEEFAEMTTAAGLDFDLASTAWGGSVEILADVGDDFRIRGSVGVSRLHGAYSEGYDPLSYVMIGLLTGGLGFLLPESEDVIDLNDESITVEAQAYYILTRNSGLSVSAGAGPVLAFVSRKLDSPNTTTKGSGTGFGVVGSLRLDQESPINLGCMPLLFGIEAGYRLTSVDLDDSEAEDFRLDFSGPFVKAGTYIGI
jgi:hypothetical protein